MNHISLSEALMISGGVDLEYMQTLERNGKLQEYMEEVLSHVTWNRRTKRTKISKLLIANIGHFVDANIDKDRNGVPILKKTACGGLYYARLATYFHECKEKAIEIMGVFCYCCAEMIIIGESCVSANKGTGKKYYHLKCALLKGVV